MSGKLHFGIGFNTIFGVKTRVPLMTERLLLRSLNHRCNVVFKQVVVNSPSNSFRGGNVVGEIHVPDAFERIFTSVDPCCVMPFVGRVND